MENLEYYKILEESLKLNVEEKIWFIYNLMGSVVLGISEALETEKNLMLSPSVNHKTLDILETYSKILKGGVVSVKKESELNASSISNLLSESNKINIEEKIVLIYKLIESLKSIIIGEFIKKFKLKDIDKPRMVEINESILKIVSDYVREYSESIKSARTLENKLNVKIDLIVSGDHLLR